MLQGESSDEGAMRAKCDIIGNDYAKLHKDPHIVRFQTPVTVTGRRIAKLRGMARLHGDLKIGDKVYRRGEEVPWKFIYPFFLVHILMFGASGFFMAYNDKAVSVGFLYMHGGIAILVYTAFYFAIFGRDEVKWMLINAALGVWGISGEMDWLLSFFGKTLSSYPLHVHVIPFLYYVLYTFLLRQAVLHWTGAQEDEVRAKFANRGYVAVSLLVYTGFHLL